MKLLLVLLLIGVLCYNILVKGQLHRVTIGTCKDMKPSSAKISAGSWYLKYALQEDGTEDLQCVRMKTVAYDAGFALYFIISYSTFQIYSTIQCNPTDLSSLQEFKAVIYDIYCKTGEDKNISLKQETYIRILYNDSYRLAYYECSKEEGGNNDVPDARFLFVNHDSLSDEGDQKALSAIQENFNGKLKKYDKLEACNSFTFKLK